ncbi:hypothetical protein [Luteibacter sp. 329MFSha]|uniref:hypothetical protein n=1 Tax=Luteibacter sp. 329MFSha TaxID=1798239 RepID=UPI0008C62CC6|nr:hypothetical protein [Luteibacter sp. 329MFSha]SEV93952.1 hypothetical protein SAMN04515660_1146 [Luteibacter sp. 329MFSha]
MITEHAASARAPQTSLPLQLSIGDIEDADNGVAPPTIVEADDDRVVDLGTFEGNATVHVDAWPLMAAGQRYWLTAIAGTEEHVIVDGEPIFTPGGLDHPIERAWLEGLADRTTMIAELRIIFDPEDDASERTFSSLGYVIVAEAPGTNWGNLAHIVEDFGQYYFITAASDIYHDVPYQLRVGKIENHATTLNVRVSDKGIEMSGNDGGPVHIALNHPATRFEMRAVAPASDAEISAFDSGGLQIIHQPLVNNNVLHASSEKGIKTVVVSKLLWSQTYLTDIRVWTGAIWRNIPTPSGNPFEGAALGGSERLLETRDWTITGDRCAFEIVPQPDNPELRTLRISKSGDYLPGQVGRIHLAPRGVFAAPLRRIGLRFRREIVGNLNEITVAVSDGKTADQTQRSFLYKRYSLGTELELPIDCEGLEAMPLPGEHLASVSMRLQFSAIRWTPLYLDDIVVE